MTNNTGLIARIDDMRCRVETTADYATPVTLAQAMTCPEVQAMVDASRRTVAHYSIVHKGPVGMRTTGMALMDELAATLTPFNERTTDAN